MDYRSQKPLLLCGFLLFLSEGPDQVHQIPPYLFLRAITFSTHHFAAAVCDDLKQRSVRILRNRLWILPIAQLQFH